MALFLARGGRLRWLVFGLLALTLVPSLDGSLWVTKLERPALFEDDRWRAVVHPGENVLNIPCRFDGQAMLWQEEAGFGFRMTGGYVNCEGARRALGAPCRALALRRAHPAVPCARPARPGERAAGRRRADAAHLSRAVAAAS